MTHSGGSPLLYRLSAVFDAASASRDVRESLSSMLDVKRDASGGLASGIVPLTLNVQTKLAVSTVSRPL